MPEKNHKRQKKWGKMRVFSNFSLCGEKCKLLRFWILQQKCKLYNLHISPLPVIAKNHPFLDGGGVQRSTQPRMLPGPLLGWGVNDQIVDVVRRAGVHWHCTRGRGKRVLYHHSVLHISGSFRGGICHGPRCSGGEGLLHVFKTPHGKMIL